MAELPKVGGLSPKLINSDSITMNKVKGVIPSFNHDSFSAYQYHLIILVRTWSEKTESIIGLDTGNTIGIEAGILLSRAVIDVEYIIFQAHMFTQ